MPRATRSVVDKRLIVVRNRFKKACKSDFDSVALTGTASGPYVRVIKLVVDDVYRVLSSSILSVHCADLPIMQGKQVPHLRV